MQQDGAIFASIEAERDAIQPGLRIVNMKMRLEIDENENTQYCVLTSTP